MKVGGGASQSKVQWRRGEGIVAMLKGEGGTNVLR